MPLHPQFRLATVTEIGKKNLMSDYREIGVVSEASAEFGKGTESENQSSKGSQSRGRLSGRLKGI
jgi:hypothetical protein